MKQYRKLWMLDHWHTMVLDGQAGAADEHVQLNDAQIAKNTFLRYDEGAWDTDDWRAKLQQARDATKEVGSVEAAGDAAAVEPESEPAESAPPSQYDADTSEDGWYTYRAIKGARPAEVPPRSQHGTSRSTPRLNRHMLRTASRG